MQIEHIERECHLEGKRTVDIPELAGFRRKYRWRFYRLADAGMFFTVFNFILATEPLNPGWWISAFVGLPLAGFVVLLGEMGARTMTRQLQRRAAEQLWLDLNGLHYE